MSWWSSSTQFDEQVEKATSNSLPNGESDLALNLEICDLIRSKTVPPKDAMRSLKRRVLNRNPNVQMSTLKLIDICIKNGGSHFLVEVASREFIDQIVSIIHNENTNTQVKEMMLDFLQQWSKAFKGQIQLQYVEKTVNSLKSEGINFPDSKDIHHVSSSFIDTKAPPEWIDSEVCMESGILFSFINRKHHCRNCGGVFTQQCCSNYTTLPHFGINQLVRVCNGCFKKLKQTQSKIVQKENITNSQNDDIQKAISLSLEDRNNSVTCKINESHNTPSMDNDEDMKAAIAASLKDMEREKENKNKSNISTHPTIVATENILLDSNQLSQAETENIDLFVLLIERLKAAPPGTILHEPKIQELHNSLSNLRLKLARSIGETMYKYDQLIDMHANVSAAIRRYDGLLEERLNQSFRPQKHYNHDKSHIVPYGRIISSEYSRNYENITSPTSNYNKNCESPVSTDSLNRFPLNMTPKPSKIKEDPPPLIEL